MNKKALHTLEYNKVIERLGEHAQTAAGRRICSELLPMTDIDDIREALAQTTDAVTRIRLNGNISLSGARDIGNSLARLKIGSPLNIPELLDIASVLETAAHAKSYGKREDGSDEDSLDVFFRILEGEASISREIRRCLISDEEVADDASAALKKVRRELANSETRIHSQLNAVLNSSRDKLQDPIITMRGGRYCLPVKAEYKGSFPGMVHDQSSSGSTYFIEPMSVVKLNNEIRELQIKEKQEIDALLARLSGQCAKIIDILHEDSKVLTTLDFIFTKARYSNTIEGNAPIFNEDKRIDLRNARHPLLDPKKVVPISVKLGGDYDLLIVTGPNTGGKTVSLKTVGLLCLMGQAGLHIPAFDGSELSIFTNVFADIGDEQSIEQSLSTFSAHMTNIVSIMKEADEDSLCLFDELGAGTDPTEGAALAMAILNSLHMQGIRTMATTHYSELKVFALQSYRVENASCEFDVATLRPTYRLMTGIPGKSNAFAIAGKLGINENVIEEARGYISHEELAFEDVISDLEDTRRELDSERAEAARYREEIETLRAKMSRTEADLVNRREKMMDKANEEARDVLMEAKSFVDETIKKVRQITDDKNILRELEKQRAELNARLNEADAKKVARDKKQKEKASGPKARKPKSKDDLKLGDKVRVISMGLEGTVSTVPNNKGELFVQMGIMRSKVKLNDIEIIDEATSTVTDSDGNKYRTDSKVNMGKAKRAAQRGIGGAGSIGMGKAMSIAGEINLIGKNTDEALPLLDKYLDDAYLAHRESVRVIHGRGTGALKNAVHNMLRKSSHVKSYRLGEYGEGGIGVTIVTFKE